MTVTLIRQEAYTKAYIGLKTDDKPSGESSYLKDGVNNGDTFYEVDTAKTFIFYEGDWYDMSDGSKESS